MREELYAMIRERLMATGAIKYVDLWNHNVEFIEQETAWERPAVFVEFGPIIWQPYKGKEVLRGSGSVRLHIVTDWFDGEPSEAGINALNYSTIVYEALKNMVGENFHGWELQETHTNHNHEDIVENIDVYSVRGFLISLCTPQQ